MGVGPLVLGALVLGALAGAAEAAPRVDWAAGLVTATGVGVANRAAPTPAAARGPARRAAEEAARRELAAALPALPLAGGGTLADRLGDAAVKARIDRAVVNALVVAAEPETDGSWKATLAVPIEAVRQALAGPRALDGDGDKGPAVVIVEGIAATPAVGALPAATLWIKDVPAWAKGAPRVKAPAAAGDLPAKGTAATLYLLVR